MYWIRFLLAGIIATLCSFLLSSINGEKIGEVVYMKDRDLLVLVGMVIIFALPVASADPLIAKVGPESSGISNYEVMTAMDRADDEIQHLRELIEEYSPEIELGTERQALVAAENFFNEGKREFGRGNLYEAYRDFNSALNTSIAAQKSVLEKLYAHNLNITKRLISEAERAGIRTTEYVESIQSAIKSKEELKKSSIKDEIEKLRLIVGFLVETREKLVRELNEAQERALATITRAEAKVRETKMYPFNSDTPEKLLERAKILLDKGEYLKAESYAQRSIEISEQIIVLGRIAYISLFVVSLFVLWVFYERKKPESRRNIIYKKIFSRKRGGIHVW